MAIAIARWGSRIVNVNALANFFRASEGGTEAAAAGASISLSGSSFPSILCSPGPIIPHYLAAEEIEAEAEASEKTLQGKPAYRHIPFF